MEEYMSFTAYAFFIGMGAGLFIGISIAAIKWLFEVTKKFLQ